MRGPKGPRGFKGDQACFKKINLKKLNKLFFRDCQDLMRRVH